MKLEFKKDKLPLALDYPMLDKEGDFFMLGTMQIQSGTNSPKVYFGHEANLQCLTNSTHAYTESFVLSS